MKRVVSTILLSVLLFWGLAFRLSSTQASPEEHVYYGYVPPTTDATGYFVDPIGGHYLEVLNLTLGLTMVIDGEAHDLVKYPSGTALLDVIGVNDGTHVEILDLITKEKLASITVDSLKLYTIPIKIGTFFKVVSDKRVALYLWGGTGYGARGSSELYPSVDGGFIGEKFVFLAATTTDTYTEARRGTNFLMFALEDTEYYLADSTGKEIKSGSVSTRNTVSQLLACRFPAHWAAHAVVGGSGNSIIFSLKTSKEVMISSQSTGAFIYIPTLEGGFVGKKFYVPVYVTIDEPGGTAAVLIIPHQPGKVTIYNLKLDVLAEKTFTQDDVDNKNFWFQTFGKSKQNLLIQSEGDVSVLSGSTRGTEEPDYLGPDVAFLGTRPGQELRFYAPTSAIIFSPTRVSALIDGKTYDLEYDGYVVLGSGVHTVKADQVLIVQVLGSSLAWVSWGAYLIEPLDVTKTYSATFEGLWSKQFELPVNLITAGGAVVVIVVVFVLFRRRKGVHGTSTISKVPPGAN
jgi:hypothetical protein